MGCFLLGLFYNLMDSSLEKILTPFLLKYNFLKFKVKYISIFDFLNLIPENNIHILSSLPYINDIKMTIDVWRNMALNKLNFLNRFTN